MSNVSAIFEKHKERSLNVLNNDSVKLSFNYIDKIDNFEDFTLLDENGEKILDTSILLPQNKAYIVFCRVHFGNLYENNIKIAISKLLQYLLHENDLNYITSAIYLDILASNIPIYLAEEIGFFPYFLNSLNLYVYPNMNFIKEIENIIIDSKTKKALLKDFSNLNTIYNKYLSHIQRSLELEEAYLADLMETDSNQDLVQMKENNIKHYKHILNIANNKKET